MGVSPSAALGDVFTRYPLAVLSPQSAKSFPTGLNQGCKGGQAHVIVPGLALRTSKLALRKACVLELPCELKGDHPPVLAQRQGDNRNCHGPCG